MLHFKQNGKKLYTCSKFIILFKPKRIIADAVFFFCGEISL